MSDAIKSSKEETLKATNEIRELFGVAHDLVAQASHPGHMGEKVARVLAFLRFQYDDFKQRADRLAKDIELEAKVVANVVDVEAAKAATEAVLSESKPQEMPKA